MKSGKSKFSCHGWCKQLPRLVQATAMVGAGNCHGWCKQLPQLVQVNVRFSLEKTGGAGMKGL